MSLNDALDAQITDLLNDPESKAKVALGLAAPRVDDYASGFIATHPDGDFGDVYGQYSPEGEYGTDFCHRSVDATKLVIDKSGLYTLKMWTTTVTTTGSLALNANYQVTVSPKATNGHGWMPDFFSFAMPTVTSQDVTDKSLQTDPSQKPAQDTRFLTAGTEIGIFCNAPAPAWVSMEFYLFPLFYAAAGAAPQIDY